MIGKNAGIRRAAGEFILATNIDILLDDSLFECIARKNLDPQRMYRADRYDIDTAIPEGGHEARQAFCRDTQNHVRRNHRLDRGAYYRLQEETPFESSLLLSKKHNFSWGEFTGGAFPSVALKPETPLALLNNNACGDFTLLHRDAWTAIRGYGEFEAWSFNIDSIGCMQAHAAGFPEVSFLPPLVCYHVEHAPASGWTPEHGEKVFERIVKAGIPYLEWNFLNKTVVKAIRQNAGAPFVFNDERWGLRDFDLAETVFAPKKKRGIKASIAPRDFRPLAAILPFWHVDTMLQNFLLDDDDEEEEVAYSPRQAVRHLYIAFVPRRIRLVLRKMRGKG
jgi:hypothetical protein